MRDRQHPSGMEVYPKLVKRRRIFLLALTLCLIFFLMLSVSTGSSNITFKQVFLAVYRILLGGNLKGDTLTQTVNIVWNIRLPRALMAVAAGVGLALSGVVLQAVLRNPLASPYTLGVASSAAFGAAVAIVCGAGIIHQTYLGGFTITHPYLVVVSAFAFSMLSVAVIVVLARFRRASPETIILAGIAMLYLFSASTSLIEYLGTTEQVAAVIFWMFGSLSKASWGNLQIVTLATIASFLALFRWSWGFNAMLLGDEVAKSLGINVERLRMAGMTLASFATAAAVSFLGTIGFIGLVAPHIARMILGGDHKYLIPASCLVGANILLVADTAARTMFSPLILPVGILTSFLGVPLFIYLLLKRRREYW